MPQDRSGSLYRRRAKRAQHSQCVSGTQRSPRERRPTRTALDATRTFFSVRAMFSLSSFWPAVWSVVARARTCRGPDAVNSVIAGALHCFSCIFLWENGCDIVLICSIATYSWIFTMRLLLEVYSWQGKFVYYLCYVFFFSLIQNFVSWRIVRFKIFLLCYLVARCVCYYHWHKYSWELVYKWLYVVGRCVAVAV